MDLATPLRAVVGARTADALRTGLGVETAHDLLRHYPRRYFERGELTSLTELEVGEQATVQARVMSVQARQIRPRLHKTDMVVTDGLHDMPVTFFNQRWIKERHQPGSEVVLSGKVERFHRHLRMTNPEIAREDVDDFAGGIRPVYAATKAMSSGSVGKAVRLVLDVLGPLPDPLPDTVRARRKLPGLRDAYERIHRPRERSDWVRAQQRFRFEEAFVLQVELARRRRLSAALPAVPRRGGPGGLLDAFDARLPFALTPGQRSVGDDIAADLARPHPMHRLLQGEVGSGKTVVALRAMLAVVDAGGQAVLLAPTEVLAQQHHRSITALLGPLAEQGLLGGSEVGTRVALLTGSLGAAARRSALLEAASGQAGIVVGTHALLEERVSFADLGLVVVDEQHRFGVEQRAALSAKSAGETRPHVLVMTATPIPRTVAMTVFGDLETSTLADLPPGRAEVVTHLVPAAEKPHFLERAWQRVAEEARAGRQVYVVCARIGDGSDADAEGPDRADEPTEDEGPARPIAAVLEVADLLRQGPLAGVGVGVLHGRMTPEAKDDAMRRFASGEVPVLVATTVVEVGVDVPTASTMVVLDADRFGVSQLHQLRGRVGRGDVPGLCLLVTTAPDRSPSRARLAAVTATRDGFELSRVDLEHRREGDVLGAAQSGRRSSLRLLSVLRHEDVIRDARQEAGLLVDADPDLATAPALAALVEDLVGEERAEFLEKA
ncbi:MAG TPA: ATP-dependent DNA helicase RecG [Jiangellales bacterium]|nr:ATP-dependent DNA helicase RecG [Jiangellales bacterium]